MKASKTCFALGYNNKLQSFCHPTPKISAGCGPRTRLTFYIQLTLEAFESKIAFRQEPCIWSFKRGRFKPNFDIPHDHDRKYPTILWTPPLLVLIGWLVKDIKTFWTYPTRYFTQLKISRLFSTRASAKTNWACLVLWSNAQAQFQRIKLGLTYIGVAWEPCPPQIFNISIHFVL